MRCRLPAAGCRLPEKGPPHPIEGFARRAARLRVADRDVGLLAVHTDCWWSVSGHLWWRRFEDPWWSADVLTYVGGERGGGHYYAGPKGSSDSLAGLVEELGRGVWRDESVGTTFALEWLDRDEGNALARELLGLDLAED